MPYAAPVHRPIGQRTPKQRKAEADKAREHVRIRGRRRMERNQTILVMHPMCRACNEALAVEVDHITPLHQGGTDTDDNLQGLCIPCHQAKTNRERGRVSR
jgi:5-methylcytosine-specific restriction protein A